jgi:transposase
MHYRFWGLLDSCLAASAFAPVMALDPPKLAEVSLSVTLPNGVKLALQVVGLTDLSPLLHGLAALPCSASSQD